MGLRVVATLLGVALVVVVALVARELGGDRRVQTVAAAITALSSLVMVVSHMLATNSADTVLWALVGLFALKLFRTNDPRWWLALGAAIGVGLENKWLVLLLVFALGVGVLAVGPRSVLRTWWLTAGVAVALALAAPGLVWQAMNDWPLLTVTAAWVAPTLAWLTTRARRQGAAVAAVVGVAMNAIAGLPVLPVSALGPAMALNAEQGEQVGWREFTATVADVWDSVPDAAVIFTSNYGQAGAIEHYRHEFGLPQPFSGHMSYYDWGPPADSRTGSVVLVGGVDPALFESCSRVAVHESAVDNDEQGTPVVVCAGPVRPWSELWPDLRRYY